MLFVQLHDLFVHFASLADILFGLFVFSSDGFHFGLQLLHLGHGFGATVGQREKQYFDDDGQNDDGKSPVGKDRMDVFDGRVQNFGHPTKKTESDDFFCAWHQFCQSIDIFWADKSFFRKV